MRKLTNKQSGFTLIEIIVVLIIVGVLAAIALPSLFGNIGKSKGAEAVASLGAYKSQIEGCIQGHIGGEAVCATAPGTVGNFAYAFTTAPANASQNWILVATAQAPLAAGTVMLTRTGGTTVNPTIVCSATGTYASIC
jgi:prepilin-type N-terminal cleavage/methylation domain-containing protein